MQLMNGNTDHAMFHFEFFSNRWARGCRGRTGGGCGEQAGRQGGRVGGGGLATYSGVHLAVPKRVYWIVWASLGQQSTRFFPPGSKYPSSHRIAMFQVLAGDAAYQDFSVFHPNHFIWVANACVPAVCDERMVAARL